MNKFKFTLYCSFTFIFIFSAYSNASNFSSKVDDFRITSNLIKYISAYQGIQPKAYKDKSNNIYIGIGYRLFLDNHKKNISSDDYNKCKMLEVNSWEFNTDSLLNGNRTLSTDMSLHLLTKDINASLKVLNELIPDFQEFSLPRKYALIDIVVNIGENTFKKFKRLILECKNKNWDGVLREIENSLYYKQNTNRANRNINTIKLNTVKSTLFKAPNQIEYFFNKKNIEDILDTNIKKIHRYENFLLIEDISNQLATEIKNRPNFKNQKESRIKKYAKDFLFQNRTIKTVCDGIDKVREVHEHEKQILEKNWTLSKAQKMSQKQDKTSGEKGAAMAKLVVSMLDKACKAIEKYEQEEKEKAKAEKAKQRGSSEGNPDGGGRNNTGTRGSNDKPERNKPERNKPERSRPERDKPEKEGGPDGPDVTGGGLAYSVLNNDDLIIFNLKLNEEEYDPKCCQLCNLL